MKNQLGTRVQQKIRSAVLFLSLVLFSQIGSAQVAIIPKLQIVDFSAQGEGFWDLSATLKTINGEKTNCFWRLDPNKVIKSYPINLSNYSEVNLVIDAQRYGSGYPAMKIELFVDNDSTELTGSPIALVDSKKTYSFKNLDTKASTNCVIKITQKSPTNQVAGRIYSISLTGIRGPEITAPQFSLPEGTYYGSQSVGLEYKENQKIYFTTDGTDPTETSSEFNTEIALNQSATIKAVAISTEQKSEIAAATYTIKLEKPVVLPPTNLKPNKFTANWNEVSAATGYEVNLYKQTNPNEIKELFFSQYYSRGVTLKAVEIYNGTDKVIDLSDYSLVLSTASGKFNAPIILSGKIKPKSTYLVSYEKPSAGTGLSKSGISIDLGTDALYIIANSKYILFLKKGVDVIDRFGAYTKTALADDYTYIRTNNKISPSAAAFYDSDWTMTKTTTAIPILDDLNKHTCDNKETFDLIKSTTSNTSSIDLTCDTGGIYYYYTVTALNGDLKSETSERMLVNAPASTDKIVNKEDGIQPLNSNLASDLILNYGSQVDIIAPLTVSGIIKHNRTFAEGRKWYAISFPFDIAKVINTTTQQEIIPTGDGIGDFWLRTYSNEKNAFVNVTTSIKAGVGYIIMLPDREIDIDENVYGGDELCFVSASGTQLKTPTANESLPTNTNYDFLGNSFLKNRSLEIPAFYLNESGTSFELQDPQTYTLAPFESFILSAASNSARSISIANGTTALETPINNPCIIQGAKGELIIQASITKTVHVYSLQGVLIRQVEVKEGKTQIPLEPGVYVVENQKVIIL